MDGTNLDKVASELRGVTCWFATRRRASRHPLTPGLARDRGVMRASIQTREDHAHHAEYEALLDRDKPEGRDVLRELHDIVTPGGAHMSGRSRSGRARCSRTGPSA